MIKYTPEFRFSDGIYLNFDQVKMNSPIPKTKILTSTNLKDKDFFKNLLAGKKIIFYDGMGIRHEAERDSIWGYSSNGSIYIQIQGEFNIISFIGNICHFFANVTSYDSSFYRQPYPYRYYEPISFYRDFNSVVPIYDPYSKVYYSFDNYPLPKQNLTRNELRQYLIDFGNGEIMELDIESTELLLMKDSQLYKEFMQLPHKKKQELKFVYILKFNEKNPLYIPESKSE
jgi:hypothetical protein